MPALALADALKDFGSQPRPAPPPDAPAERPHLEIMEMRPQPEPDAVQAAVDAATAELSARLEAEHAQAIETLTETHRQQIAAIQAEMGEQVGTLLANRFGEFEQHLVELVSNSAARILGIALTEDIQAKAIETLGAAITDAVRDREAVRIRIQGPLSLYEALQPRLGDLAARVDFTETAGLDLSAAIDDTLVETRLSEWSASLSEIMS